MLTFKDKKGYVWDCTITAGAVEDVKGATGLDLYNAGKEDFSVIKQIVENPPMLINVVYTIVRPQMPDITPREFLDRLNGDALEDLGEAFVDAVADFSGSRLRKLIRKGMEKSKKMQDSTTQKVLDAMENLTEKQMLRLMSGDKSGNGPESSESTPVPSGSES